MYTDEHRCHMVENAMMLLFKDDGWEVCTNAWTVAAVPGDIIAVVYTWGPDQVSFMSASVVGTAKCKLNITMEEFRGRLRKGVALDGICDLRDCS